MTTVKIHNEKEVTIADIVANATALSRDVPKYTPDELWDKYRDLARAYPVVFKYIVYEKLYDKNVFTKYLKYIARSPWKTEKEFVQQQAEYPVMLYKHKNHPSKEQVNKFRKQVVTSLQSEHDQLKKLTAAAAADVEDWERRRDAALSVTTAEFFEEHGQATKNVDTIKSTCDITPVQLSLAEPIAPPMTFEEL